MDPVKPLRCTAASAMGAPGRHVPGASGGPKKLIRPARTCPFLRSQPRSTCGRLGHLGADLLYRPTEDDLVATLAHERTKLG